MAVWGDSHVCLRLEPRFPVGLKGDMQDWDNLANDRPPFQPRDGRSIPAPPCSLHLIDIIFPVLQPRVLDKMLHLKPKTKVIYLEEGNKFILRFCL